MADPPAPDPYADEWKRAVKSGSYQDRKGLIVAGASVLSALGFLGVWIYAYHDETYVYVRSGQDASMEILKRGIVFALVIGLVVALVLSRALGLRESAYTKGLAAFFKR